jgi:hypothetical protein
MEPEGSNQPSALACPEQLSNKQSNMNEERAHRKLFRGNKTTGLITLRTVSNVDGENQMKIKRRLRRE